MDLRFSSAGFLTSALRSISRSSVAMIVSALILAAAVSANTYYTARGGNHDTTYYACLYAGSLSQVGATPPASCGRGTVISWNSEGIQGEPGLDGVSGHQQVQSLPVTLAPGETNRAFVVCPPGKVVLGGGPVWVAGDSATMTVTESYPAVDTWNAWARNDGNEELSFSARAICAFAADEEL